MNYTCFSSSKSKDCQNLTMVKQTQSFTLCETDCISNTERHLCLNSMCKITSGLSLLVRNKGHSMGPFIS